MSANAPGELIHVDVKKLGNIPDGGGWRYLGRVQGTKNRRTTRGRTGASNVYRNLRVGTCFAHTVTDDYTRIAYAECHDNETAATAVAVLRRAVAWFAERGITMERVLSDNGSPYISHLWRDTCAELAITPSRHHAKADRPRRT